MPATASIRVQSSGSLVNLCGVVVGINTLAGRKGQNLNFAVPIDIVQDLVPQLVAQGRVIRPWHGIHGTASTAGSYPRA